MTPPDWVWATLALAPTTERASIRRAYAKRLRENPPGTDAPAFQRLRRAYEAALAYAAGGPSGRTSAAAPAATPTTAAPHAPAAVVDADYARDRSVARDALAALAALEGRLAGRVPSSTADLQAALDRALGAAAAIQIAHWPSFEAALAALLGGVVRRLGWGRDHLDGARNYHVDALATRLAGLEAAAAIRDVGGNDAQALAVLTSPPPTGDAIGRFAYGFRHASQVRQFMRHALVGNPALGALLDAKTRSWWTEYLKIPHLSQRLALVGVLFSSYALATISVLDRTGQLGATHGPRAVLFALAILAGPALALGWLGLVLWPRYLMSR